METLRDFAELWGQFQARHAMLVHLPVVLSLVCAVAAVISAIAKRRVASLRWMTLIFTAALIGAAFAATATGDLAKDAVEDALSPQADAVLEKHEELADFVWPIAAAGFVLTALSFIGGSVKPPPKRDDEEEPAKSPPPPPKLGFGGVAAWLAAIVLVGGAGWVGLTAHQGGKLVYQYGAVIPTKAGPAGPSSESDDPRVTFFQEHAFPILRDNCMHCHTPAKLRRVNNLDQTSIAGLLRGGDSGPAIVPGRPDESILVHAIRYEDKDLEMPPSGKLDDADIAAIEQWIRDGAVWVVPVEADADADDEHEMDDD